METHSAIFFKKSPVGARWEHDEHGVDDIRDFTRLFAAIVPLILPCGRTLSSQEKRSLCCSNRQHLWLSNKGSTTYIPRQLFSSFHIHTLQSTTSKGAEFRPIPPMQSAGDLFCDIQDKRSHRLLPQKIRSVSYSARAAWNPCLPVGKCRVDATLGSLSCLSEFYF